MPRKIRFNLPGIPQHVIQRGNNREPCFYAEADYRRYLDSLNEVAEKFDCRIHAYVLMTNHVHLLITPMQEYGIPQTMQALGRRYVYYINKTYKRTGTLWEGRYKSSLIDSERYLLTCMRYIELNPIRAHMVSHPGGYQWSSYAANAQGKTDELLSNHPVYEALGDTPEGRQTAYRELFRHHMDNDTLHEIRESLNHELVLGRSYFKDKIEQLTQRQTRLGQPGRPGFFITASACLLGDIAVGIVLIGHGVGTLGGLGQSALEIIGAGLGEAIAEGLIGGQAVGAVSNAIRDGAGGPKCTPTVTANGSYLSPTSFILLFSIRFCSLFTIFRQDFASPFNF